jgi:hypothetical protein
VSCYRSCWAVVLPTAWSQQRPPGAEQPPAGYGCVVSSTAGMHLSAIPADHYSLIVHCGGCCERKQRGCGQLRLVSMLKDAASATQRLKAQVENIHKA